MMLTVKALQGRECSVQVSPQERVGALKLLVAERLRVPVERQRLLFRGRALADDRRLSDYAIGPWARINLVLKPGSGDPPGNGDSPGNGDPLPGSGDTPGSGDALPGSGDSLGSGDSPGSGGAPPGSGDSLGSGDTPGSGDPLPGSGDAPPGFGGALGRVLGRHLGAQEARALLGQLGRDYALGLRGLSLDDVERMGTRVLLGGPAHGGAGHAPCSPGHAPSSADHAHGDAGHAPCSAGHALAGLGHAP